MNSLVWFTRDLRLSDNPALSAAISRGAPVTALYVHDPKAQGAASNAWLRHALPILARDLKNIGIEMHLASGDASAALLKCCADYKISNVFWTQALEPAQAKLQTRVETVLTQSIPNVKCQSFLSGVLIDPRGMVTKTNQGPFRVFTPYYKTLLEQVTAPAPLPPLPDKVASQDLKGSIDISALDFGDSPTQGDWASSMMAHWRVGEGAAQEILHNFVQQNVASYSQNRDFPDGKHTSQLSPYLHFGHITPWQIWRACSPTKGCEGFLRQLVWREFSLHLLHHNPHMQEQPLQSFFAHFPWQPNAQHLKAWQRGQTGYPIVDAGMRELWATGWMHNRVRMIVASFLVKHLLQPWQDGQAWFWDTLVDADLANNSASWQWVAGSGADAAPYFRIFNPILQGEKFDPQGHYVRRWVPEVAHLPDAVIHKPWQAPMLAPTYPAPLVEHNFARDRALAAYQDMKLRASIEP